MFASMMTSITKALPFMGASEASLTDSAPLDGSELLKNKQDSFDDEADAVDHDIDTKTGETEASGFSEAVDSALSDDEYESFESEYISDFMEFIEDDTQPWSETCDDMFCEDEADVMPVVDETSEPLVLSTSEMVEGEEGVDFFSVTKADTGVTKLHDFDAADDTVQIDMVTDQPIIPKVSVDDFGDGTGAFISLDGVVVAEVTGAQNLDPMDVVLLPV